ncbi:hypothetical protein NDU88_001599 [Pleurodeles waltl]|uniref:Uncharacterized protein n=1 Tax=Pleurodeles waltl TaxID=8319 RepID=A0AAV7W1H7_PLEWA|nr:hypothetical protein NDU88_001599 [Pleurodeles waltl]
MPHNIDNSSYSAHNIEEYINVIGIDVEAKEAPTSHKVVLSTALRPWSPGLRAHHEEGASWRGKHEDRDIVLF